MRAFCLHLACVAALLAGTAQATEITEPASATRFQTPLTYQGTPYVLVGTGLRKKLFIKVYAMALYVDQNAAKQPFQSLVNKAKGRPQDSDRAADFVAWGRFGKLAVLHFLRDVDQGKIQEAYRDSLAGALSEQAAPELRQGAQAFVALFDKDMREGQDVRIATSDTGQITVEIAGVKKDGPKNPQLARAIWEIWLGPKPISKELRRDLVSHIDELAH